LDDQLFVSLVDFAGLREVRVLGRGAFGVVQLLEDPSAHDLIAVKLFDSETTQASDRSSAFFREIDALVDILIRVSFRLLVIAFQLRGSGRRSGQSLQLAGRCGTCCPRLTTPGRISLLWASSLG
jgi:hypothetical protein